MSSKTEDRQALEATWFELTRETMPDLAVERGWSVRFDHCFQRILLDNACGGPWRDHIAPPAYKNAPLATLRRAIELGNEAIEGESDLAELNRRSLVWRRKRGPPGA